MRPLMVLMLCLLLPLTIATAATAAGSIHGQLRILAVPLLPTSPALDMMAVLAELSSRCVCVCLLFVAHAATGVNS